MNNLDESTRRLLKLATFLEDTVPPEQFDYRSWATGPWKGVAEEQLPAGCGTTACAFGWATAVPEFREMGLHIARTGYSTKVLLDDHEGFDAAAELFMISVDEATLLFNPSVEAGDYNLHDFSDMASPDFDAGPAEVARHIREFVNRRLVVHAVRQQTHTVW